MPIEVSGQELDGAIRAFIDNCSIAFEILSSASKKEFCQLLTKNIMMSEDECYPTDELNMVIEDSGFTYEGVGATRLVLNYKNLVACKFDIYDHGLVRNDVNEKDQLQENEYELTVYDGIRKNAPYILPFLLPSCHSLRYGEHFTTCFPLARISSHYNDRYIQKRMELLWDIFSDVGDMNYGIWAGDIWMIDYNSEKDGADGAYSRFQDRIMTFQEKWSERLEENMVFYEKKRIVII